MNKQRKDMESIVENPNKEIVKNVGHRFQPGHPGGPGRPKGALSKFTPASLLKAIETTVGKPFVQSLAEGYKDSIDRGDHKTRYLYEKAILDKVVADRVSVEVDDGATMESKMQAFAQALNGFTVNSTHLPTINTIPLDRVEHDYAPNNAPTIEPQWDTIDNGIAHNSQDTHQDNDETHQDDARDDDTP
jgi:hypothetical protein